MEKTKYNIAFKLLDHTFGDNLTIFPVQIQGYGRGYKCNLHFNDDYGEIHAGVYFKIDLSVFAVVQYSSRIASLFDYWLDLEYPSSTIIIKEWIETKRLIHIIEDEDKTYKDLGAACIRILEQF